MPPAGRSTSGGLDVAVLVRRHQAGLWRFLRALGCDARVAEEVAQDTFVAVLQRPFVEVDERATAAYLRTVAKRLLWKARRGRPRHESVAPEALEAAFAAACPDGGGMALEALRGCVEGLDANARALVDAHYRDGESRASLGRRFAMSEDGIKSWLRRVRAALRECVERKVSR